MQPVERTDLRLLPPVREAEGIPPPLDTPPGRPPVRIGRLMRAYWVTLIVVASYLSVRVQARFRSSAVIEELLQRKHHRNAHRIERTIIALQGLFIKVGQLISIMTNFLPAEFREELERLRDQVPPRPYSDIEQRLREEFGGRSPAALFAEFCESPIAAASIGQVHVARLHSGEKVAVKIQYPDIEAIVQMDLRILKRVFRIVSWFAPYRGLEHVYREIRDVIMQELDFRAEAANVARIGCKFTGRKDVAFPTVVPELTTGRVLTTLWEDGIRVGDREHLDAARVDRKMLSRRIVETYCQQIFVDGVYHADPHPGNLLVREDAAGPVLVFLDFGAVAELSPRMRRGMVEFLQGAIHRDTQRIVRAMKEMGFVARDADERVFDKVIEYFHQRFQEELQLESFNLKDIKFNPRQGIEKLADLRRMNISFRHLSESFHVPKEWILLERTILLLMGLCTELDPEMNPMGVIRPYVERFVLGPDADWSKLVLDTTKDVALSALALPGELRRLMVQARRGELEVTFTNVDDAVAGVVGLGRQIMATAIGITGAALAVVYEGRGDWESAGTAWWVCGGAGIVLALLLMSHGRRRRRR